MELGQRALEGLEVTSTFWTDRPTLVTGGLGLVGSWLVKRLVDHGASAVGMGTRCAATYATALNTTKTTRLTRRRKNTATPWLVISMR